MSNSSTPTERKRLNTDEAAAYLGPPFTRGRLEILRMKGRGPAYLKIERLVFYEPDDLDAYLASLRRTQTSGSQRKMPRGEEAKPAA